MRSSFSALYTGLDKNLSNLLLLLILKPAIVSSEILTYLFRPGEQKDEDGLSVKKASCAEIILFPYPDLSQYKYQVRIFRVKNSFFFEK